MDIDVIIARYLDVWAREDVPSLLKMLHPQASYFDAYWLEQCTGHDLHKYFSENFALENRRYEMYDSPIITKNGFIIRYVALKKHDTDGENPLFYGAEIVTVSDGLILTISDVYCDPDPTELVELAKSTEARHGQAYVAEQGLGSRVAARIHRRLAELADSSSVYLDPDLTVTMLADRIGCSVMHLFHVLEVEKNTSFVDFVNECRARHATTLLSNTGGDLPDMQRIAEECGFPSRREFYLAFDNTFSMSPEDYAARFAADSPLN